MKRLYLFILAAICLVAVHAESYRIASYNIRNGIGIDGQQDRARLAETIKSIDADIIGVQEVDSATRRCNNAFVLGELAEASGMTPIYAPAIDYDGGRYGIGMLCRTAPESIVRIPLPGREEPRTALICLWPDLAVCCTHLSLTDEDRTKGALIAAGKLMEVAGERPAVMLGDFNTPAESELWTQLELVYGLKRINGFNAPTFPSDTPTETIDFILISGNKLSASTIEVIESTASDHRPILSTIQIQN